MILRPAHPGASSTLIANCFRSEICRWVLTSRKVRGCRKSAGRYRRTVQDGGLSATLYVVSRCDHEDMDETQDSTMSALRNRQQRSRKDEVSNWTSNVTSNNIMKHSHRHGRGTLAPLGPAVPASSSDDNQTGTRTAWRARVEIRDRRRWSYPNVLLLSYYTKSCHCNSQLSDSHARYRVSCLGSMMEEMGLLAVEHTDLQLDENVERRCTTS